MPSDNQARNWVFTSYKEQAPAYDSHVLRYMIYGRETCPTTGRKHWQGYLQLVATKKTRIWVKTHVEGLGEAHLEPARGGYDANKAYCSKEGEWEEFGEPIKANGPRERTDLTTILRQIEEGRSVEDLMPEYPDAIARHLRFFQLAETQYMRRNGKEKLKAKILALTLYPWQDAVVQLSVGDPDPRRVHWRWDPTGATGKSTVVDYLVAVGGAAVFTGGSRLGDIAHAYNFERIVCFDLSRTAAEHADSVYSAIEMFKNGRIFSPKYESTTKIFEKPHVFVFANWEPDTTKLSEDRWDIVRVTI